MEPELKITDADLQLLLAESDREAPYLFSPRRAQPPEPHDELDGRILAGLVAP